MKVAIIAANNIRYSPYIFFYTKIFSELNYEISLFYPNRCGINESFSYGESNPYNKWTKNTLISYLKYTRWVSKLLNKGKYDIVISLTSIISVFLSFFLKKNFRNRYITDIRDYSYEKYSLFRKLEKIAFQNSLMNIISSEKFKNFLPEANYHICHNTSFNSLGKYKFEKKDDAPIVIGYIGGISHEEQCYKMIDLVRRDERFCIYFFGQGPSSQKVENYCKKVECERIICHGAYSPSEKENIITSVDILFNAYGNNSPLLDFALSNKLYDAFYYKKPLLTSPNTYMSEYSGILSYEIDLENEKNLDNLFYWFKALDKKAITNFIDQTFNNIIMENNKTIDNIKLLCKKIAEEKMKVVYAVYHDCNKEERSNELLECCKNFGEVHFISYAYPKETVDSNMHFYVINKNSPIALFTFIHKAMSVIKKEKPDIVVLHDSDCSVLLPFTKKNSPQSKIIYDSSELDMPMEGKPIKKRNNGLIIKIKGFLTTFRVQFEKKYLRNADVVIAANYERASAMVDYFKLKKQPIVFDNMHRINEEYNLVECEHKFKNLFCQDKFNVLFAGGIDEERQTFDFIDAFISLEENFRLIIVGSASQVALNRFNSILKNHNLKDKITYLGSVSRSELKYLIQNSQASAVVFDKDSYNTLYCASGKLYESLFEGCPLICSDNPPLKRLCDTYNIGIATNDFADGIMQLEKKYNTYCENVEKYILKLNYTERISKLTETIKRELL